MDQYLHSVGVELLRGLFSDGILWGGIGFWCGYLAG